jgi:ribonuclease P protein component
MLMRQTLKKEERLCSQKAIDDLFVKGKSFMAFPFKIIYLPQKLETSYPAQILISVSKKKLKRAVDRNKIKRLIREGYRKNKYLIYDYLKPIQKQCILGIVFVSDQMLDHDFIEAKVIAALNRLREQFEKSNK